MPNDAKLGLILGIGVVIAVAVLFFRQDPPKPTATPGSAGAAKVVLPSPADLPTPPEAGKAGSRPGQ